MIDYRKAEVHLKWKYCILVGNLKSQKSNLK